MKRNELISAVKAKDKRAYMGYRGIETPLETFLAIVNDAIAAERDRCVKAICAGCDEGKETKTIDGSLVHLWDNWKNLVPCEAELIREP